MKPISWIGLVILALGILAFVVPVPQRETHKVKVGEATFGISTDSKEKLPPAVGIVLCVAGAGLLVVGARK